MARREFQGFAVPYHVERTGDGRLLFDCGPGYCLNAGLIVYRSEMSCVSDKLIHIEKTIMLYWRPPMKNIKISLRIILSFAIVCILAVTSGIIGITSLDSTIRNYEDLYHFYGEAQGDISAIDAQFQRLRVELRDSLMQMTAGKKESSAGHIASARELVIEIDNMLLEYYDDGSGFQEDELEAFIDVLDGFKAYSSDLEEYFGYLDNGDLSAADAFLHEAHIPIAKKLNSDLSRSIELVREYGNKFLKEYSEKSDSTEILLVIITIVVFCLSDGLGILLARSIMVPLRKVVAAANKMQAGEFDFDLGNIKGKDEMVTLANTFTGVRNSVNGLVEDAKRLSAAAQAGELNDHADAGLHKGAYREVVEGINGTIDAIAVPLNDANIVLAEFAGNNYTATMDTEKYRGSIKNLAVSMNQVSKTMSSVIGLIGEVSVGNLDCLEEIKSAGKMSDKDNLMPALIACMDTINSLIIEAEKLSTEAVNGNLSARGNADNFTGKYRSIITGFNSTIGAILDPIAESINVFESFAEGDLTKRVTGDYKGDHARMKNALNITIDSLNDVITDMSASAEQVSTGAEHLAGSSQNLAQGTTEQASAVEELSASIVEMKNQAEYNAQNAETAKKISLESHTAAIAGNESMKSMLDSMRMISEESIKISNIIATIEDIAFQTNILALNAAVEAARAGQHGRGFAVVAERVRVLSDRSAVAANETATLIQGSIKCVEAGTKTSDATAAALLKVVEEINKAADLVGEIAAASEKQIVGITQINKGIEQVSTVVHSNSAVSEESAAASEELAGQADILKQLVGRFRTDGNNTVRTDRDTVQKNMPKHLGQGTRAIQLDDFSGGFGKY